MLASPAAGVGDRTPTQRNAASPAAPFLEREGSGSEEQQSGLRNSAEEEEGQSFSRILLSS